MTAATMFEKSGAQFSPCRTWRYALWRHWDWQGHANCAMFIGLNPSRANETRDDTTISKCIGFAKRWGYGGIYMLNLYAYCTTYPKELIRHGWPVGPDNDEAFGYYRTRVGLIVAAWGAMDSIKNRQKLEWESRIETVLGCIGKPVQCLGKTQDGSPRHPSRIAYSTERERFWEPTP